MTRTVALRASALFVLLTLAVAAIDAGAASAVTGAFVLVGLVLTALTATFASVTPERVPVRVTARRRR
jgi:hypothetical protein